MLAVFKRELRSFFQSPVGYVYLFFFLIVSGLVFWVANISAASTDTTTYFSWMRYILIVILPLLAMKLFPEERKNKTDQILITAPIHITSMVLGKFFAAYAVFVIGLIPTLFNMIFLASYGFLEWGIVMANYIGLLFIAMAFLAISMLMSVMTESMITAFIMGVFSLGVFALADIISELVNNTVVTKIVNAISLTQRYSEFSLGLFNIPTLVYFFSLAVIFLFLTVRVIDKRRWS